VVGAAVPWAGGAAWQREGVDLPRSSGVLVIARDSGSGRITLGEDGLPRIEYWPSARDSANMLDVRAQGRSPAFLAQLFDAGPGRR
jgi:long-chain-alcohol oxidase